MPYSMHGRFAIFGEHDADTLKQLRVCAEVGDAVGAALMADGHKGYSQPIGGVLFYDRYISPSGVGYDIACGNKAVRTDLTFGDIKAAKGKLADEIFRQVSFGIGRKNKVRVEHELFDDPTWTDVPYLLTLKQLAQDQLGTVGAGNHYVDLMAEVTSNWKLGDPIPDTAPIWVAVHFGSRGFGHRTASGFLNLAAGRDFDDRAPGESMDQPPTLIPVDSEMGQAYIAAMRLAGRYAYAGRDYVVEQVLRILGAKATFTVHNHHNYAWPEEHGGVKGWAVRKGATPLFPGQMGFIGGSMGDIAVVVRGVDGDEARAALYSTVHGSGRVMSRTQAAGKWKRQGGKRVRVGGAIDMEAVRRRLASAGVELRGAGADEAPQVYRPLRHVLGWHAPTMEVLYVLAPVCVVMAEADEYDPYKD
ncbi:MAG: RtcB family protein [Symbiobacterium sp.]|uniref:RtcB family protein n=1 Tax=Symbiobacterium sp. TaxID=1971213 RepID=UPI003463920A